MITLAVLNALPDEEFVRTLGAIFEHSPWIPGTAAKQRPYNTIGDLHAAMVAIIEQATEAEKIALLRAHPMLARRAPLTAASAAEQASHGLTSLDDAEATRFEAANEAYQARFGFPFIIAVRGQRDRAAILATLQSRLTGTPEAERAIALAEVAKIARFRLDDLIEPTGWISVHVLDTARGEPGVAMPLMLHRLTEHGPVSLGEWQTNEDGRCDTPLLQGIGMQPGSYQITFRVGLWRQASGESERGFYDDVPIRFRIDDPSVHYHVPLLVAPFGYATYRGS